MPAAARQSWLWGACSRAGWLAQQPHCPAVGGPGSETARRSDVHRLLGTSLSAGPLPLPPLSSPFLVPRLPLLLHCNPTNPPPSSTPQLDEASGEMVCPPGFVATQSCGGGQCRERPTVPAQSLCKAQQLQQCTAPAAAAAAVAGTVCARQLARGWKTHCVRMDTAHILLCCHHCRRRPHPRTGGGRLRDVRDGGRV